MAGTTDDCFSLRTRAFRTSSIQITTTSHHKTHFVRTKRLNKESTENMSTSTKKALEKGVSWGEVEILVFPNILGDNPGVSYGAPLTIGWKPESKETVGVDCFEYFRQSRPRRNRKDLMMKSTSRDT